MSAGVERRQVQARDDRLARGIALESCAAPLAVEIGHGLAGLRADSDGVDDDPRRLRLPHRLLDIALQILAVRDEHHDLVAPVLVDEQVEAPRQAHSERGARRGDDPGLHRVEEERERIGVQGQGNQRVGLTFEGHEAETVALEPGDQRGQRLAGQEEPVGRDVLRGHGAGAVEDEHHVHPFALDLLAHDPPLRAGEGQDDARSTQQQERLTNVAPSLRGATHHAGPERTRHQPRGAVAVAPGEPRFEGGDRGQREQADQPGRRLEDHVGLMRGPPAVPRPTARPPTRAAPPQRQGPEKRAPDNGERRWS